jgi:inosine-uridine nucleoside N-ribohydrolase
MRFTDYALRLDETHGKRGMNLRDPLAVGAALDSSLVEWEPVRVAVGPEGQTRRAAGERNARFARIVDTPRHHLFLERLWPVS